MSAVEILQVLVFPGLLFLLVLALFYEWIDRKFFAKVQNRYGPLYTGPAGLLQPLADFLKLLAVNDGAHIGLFIQRIADFQPGESSDEPFQEGIIDGLMQV